MQDNGMNGQWTPEQAAQWQAMQGMTPEQIAQFHKSTQSVRDEWTAKIGPDLVKAAEQDMAAAK